MSKMLVGSICLTDLMDFAKKAHSAYSRGKNGGYGYPACITSPKKPIT